MTTLWSEKTTNYCGVQTLQTLEMSVRQSGTGDKVSYGHFG